jgi:hypothetical protein
MAEAYSSTSPHDDQRTDHLPDVVRDGKNPCLRANARRPESLMGAECQEMLSTAAVLSNPFILLPLILPGPKPRRVNCEFSCFLSGLSSFPTGANKLAWIFHGKQSTVVKLDDRHSAAPVDSSSQFVPPRESLMIVLGMTSTLGSIHELTVLITVGHHGRLVFSMRICGNRQRDQLVGHVAHIHFRLCRGRSPGGFHSARISVVVKLLTSIQPPSGCLTVTS